jgi:SHAQKYF class myb-like DNA-binding protein
MSTAIQPKHEREEDEEEGEEEEEDDETTIPGSTTTTPPVAFFGGARHPPRDISQAPEGVVEPGMEHTGRWTKQEHSLFLQGIDKYGKEWKKVAGFVRTRTVMQTRTHAQKYYEKLAHVALKGGGPRNPAKKAAAASPAPPVLVAPVPVVSFTDLDILVPINDTTATRPANQEYMDVMKANCFIFHALPLTEQLWFARNIVHFLSTVRSHRWIGCHYYGTQPQYQLLTEPVSVVQSDFRMDPLKVAALAFHPLWLLGEHDWQHRHNARPFVHRTVDGTWSPVSMPQVRDILHGEGPKNLLLLPPSMPWTGAMTAVPTVRTIKGGAAPVEDPPPAIKEEEEEEKEEEKDHDDHEEGTAPARRSKRQRL